MLKMKLAGVVVGVVAFSLVGCRSAATPEPQRSSGGSLVYSPAERVNAEHAAAAAPANGPALRTGVRCRVHLRRDAVGLAGAAPLPIVGTSMLSERSSLTGVIDRVDPDAILLHVAPATYWIPRDVILAVEFPDEARP